MNVEDLMDGKAVQEKSRRIVDHTSYSSLVLLDNCTMSWYKKYIEGLTDQVGEAAKFGIAFEARLAQKLKFELSTEDRITEEDIQTVEEPVKIYLNSEKAWKEADEYQKKIEIDPDKFKHFAKKYGVQGEINKPYIGFIDFFKKGKSVMDLKTTKRAGWNVNYAYQLIPYMLATETNNSEIHQFVRKKASEVKVYNLPLQEIGAKMILEWLVERSNKAEKLQTGELEPKYTCGWRCDYCVFKDCPAKVLNKVEAE